MGWVKCYGPNIALPVPANCAFEDFVYMAALLKANRITALPASYKPLQYLRRSTSICGQRTPENFTHHIPLQLQTFFEAIIKENTKRKETLQKLKMAKEFIQRKLDGYQVTLTALIQNKTYPSLTQETLTIYLQKAQELKEWVEKSLKEKEGVE